MRKCLYAKDSSKFPQYSDMIGLLLCPKYKEGGREREEKAGEERRGEEKGEEEVEGKERKGGRVNEKEKRKGRDKGGNLGFKILSSPKKNESFLEKKSLQD